MTEPALAFTAPPQVQVGDVIFDVKVTESNPTFLDHEDYLHVAVGETVKGKFRLLAEDPRVRRNEDAVLTAVLDLALSAEGVHRKRQSRERLMRRGI